MPLFPDLKALFIHIPKTGGTAITAALGLDGEPADGRERLYGPDPTPGGRRYLHHLTARELRTEGWLPDPYRWFTFAFIRNPWDRLVSSWAFQCQVKRLFYSFSDHVDAVERQLAEDRANLFLTDRPQWEFLQPLVTQPDGPHLHAVDVLYSYENLEQNYRQLCQILGAPPRLLQSRNASLRQHWTGYYKDPALLARVCAMYSDDVRSWVDVVSQETRRLICRPVQQNRDRCGD